VSGGGFSSSGTSVTVGGLSASNVIVQDHGQLACTLPAHTAKGPHDVVVTTDGSSSGTLSDGFAYDTARIVGPVAFEQYTTIEMIVPADAGLSYFAATANGNTGVALNQWDPMDNRIFPLDDDILFVASVYRSDGIPEWRDLSGTLDMTGRATWGFWLPNWPMLQGVTIYTAAVSADANFPSGMKTITNDVAVTYP